LRSGTTLLGGGIDNCSSFNAKQNLQLCDKSTSQHNSSHNKTQHSSARTEELKLKSNELLLLSCNMHVDGVYGLHHVNHPTVIIHAVHNDHTNINSRCIRAINVSLKRETFISNPSPHICRSVEIYHFSTIEACLHPYPLNP